MGGIFSAPKAPTPPDPAATVEAEAKANRVTQFTPQGTLRFGFVGPNGEFEEDVSGEQRALKVYETPFQESLRGLGESEMLNLAQQLQGTNLSPFRTAGDIEAGLAPQVPTDFAAEAARLEDATFESGQQRLQPVFDRQREQLEQRLADQGLPMGSDAYEEELNRLEESQNEQLSRLALDAVAQGRAEQDRLARLGSALRGQSLNEQLGLSQLDSSQRQQSFAELGALLGFNTPFSQQQVRPIDVAGITNAGYANQLAAQQANQQARAQQASNIGTIGSILAFSDIRLKENIVMVKAKDGYCLYEFNYIGDDETRYRGVMAHEIEKVNPDAVTEIDGYKAVDYDKIGESLEVLQ